jgi:hypothetical protein
MVGRHTPLPFQFDAHGLKIYEEVHSPHHEADRVWIAEESGGVHTVALAEVGDEHVLAREFFEVDRTVRAESVVRAELKILKGLDAVLLDVFGRLLGGQGPSIAHIYALTDELSTSSLCRARKLGLKMRDKG